MKKKMGRIKSCQWCLSIDFNSYQVVLEVQVDLRGYQLEIGLPLMSSLILVRLYRLFRPAKSDKLKTAITSTSFYISVLQEMVKLIYSSAICVKQLFLLY